MSVCKYCGKELQQGALICRNCGKRVLPEEPEQPQRKGKKQRAKAPEPVTTEPVATEPAKKPEQKTRRAKQEKVIKEEPKPVEAVTEDAVADSKPKKAKKEKKVKDTKISVYNDDILTFANYVIMMIIQAIPLVGFIMTLIWAFGKKVNINKKNYARASLFLSIMVTVISIIMVVAIGLLYA